MRRWQTAPTNGVIIGSGFVRCKMAWITKYDSVSRKITGGPIFPASRSKIVDLSEKRLFGLRRTVRNTGCKQGKSRTAAQ